MFESVIANVIANLITAFILAVLGVSTYIILFITERQQLLRFLGITNKLPRLRVYLSRMEIKPGGTVGFEPLTYGYAGPSISKIEYEGALLVRNLVSSRPLAILPKRIRGWLSQQYVTLITIDPTIDVSPQTMDEVSFDNLVLLGSNVYNLVSKHYLEHPSCNFYFVKNEQGERVIKIREGGLKDVQIPGRSSGRELAIVQRINDMEHGNTVFICAGLGSSATYGSVRYLVENWKELQRKYKQNEFAICLAFPQQPSDGEIVVHPTVAYEMQC